MAHPTFNAFFRTASNTVSALPASALLVSAVLSLLANPGLADDPINSRDGRITPVRVSYIQPNAEPAAEDPLAELQELEQLLQTPVIVPALQQEVTTVSRQVSTVGRSPAAVFVVTNEMIRRSGFTTIPEVLRMVPGLHVARIDSNKWSIGSRGLGQRFDGKLLVQIDGRSIYNPIFAGTYWDVQDLLLEDIERIEVVRGPGATVWGANAVNGVINVITKSAKDTQGGLVMARGGTEERGTTGFRYGGSRGEDLNYRVWGKGFDRDAGFNAPGIEVDDWRQGRGGFRVDWQSSCFDTMTLQGEIFEGYSGRQDTRPTIAAPFEVANTEDERSAGGNVLYRWNHNLGERSDWTLQMYYDRFQRASSNNYFAFGVDTYDVDFQYQSPLNDYHQVVWGLGYRVNDIAFQGSTVDGAFAIGPAVTDVSRGLASGFVQDEITLADDLLSFTVGAKLQHNDFTGVNVQPTARLLLTPSQRQSAWLAVSRAVRTPAIADDNIEVGLLSPLGPPFPRVLPDTNLDNESLVAYELGYRAQPVDTFSYDIALFFNDYSKLITPVAGAPFFDPRFGTTIFPLTRQNAQSGETYGVELAATWQVREDWRLYGQYTFQQVQLHGGSAAGEGQTPHNQVYLQSSWDIRCHWQFDLIGRYVDQLPGFAPVIDSYLEMDARLAWMPNDCLELAVVGQNLLDNHHPENGTSLLLSSPIVEVQRSVYGQIVYKW
ncbi:MAG: TonB-dependent receptor [Planctomycetia bacterium]|nr:TonB-dependent receptor [Planctomycetia bacterium]